MAILLIVFYILSPLSTYNIQTTSPIYYQFYYYSLYFYILNLSSKEPPYLLLSLSIQLGRYNTKYLQKFTRLFYQISLTILLYIYNQSPKSRLDYLLSYYYPYLYLYYYFILLYQFFSSYLRPFYSYYYSIILLALASIERL